MMLTNAATPDPPTEINTSSPPYLAALNPEQRAAVEAVDGPVLVLAGAGTGKTRVLTTRIAHILATRRAYPGQILAVTFTNKAAREMAERVEKLLHTQTGMGQEARSADRASPEHASWGAEEPRTGGNANNSSLRWLGTFHSIAAKILRRHAELVGLTSSFTILDTDDQIRLIKTLLREMNIDEKTSPAKMHLAIIQGWKDKGLTPDKVSDEFSRHRETQQTQRLYALYQQRLRTVNAVDFGDLLLHNLTIFQQQPQILKEFSERFRYILVDEYQDTNVAQYLWLRLLALSHKNICCVGDDDQSIYGWRGAEVGNILKFEQDFPGAAIIRLERNYRSTGHILAAASALIANNAGRLGKTLWTEGEEGRHVRIKPVWDEGEEARYVGEEIEMFQRNKIPLAQMAVLVRAGFQTRAFEERLLTLGIPYRVVGGLRFYERQEIRDAVAYLRVVLQPHDDLAFERIVNVPKRGIGRATLEQIHSFARNPHGTKKGGQQADPASRQRRANNQEANLRLDSTPHGAASSAAPEAQKELSLFQATQALLQHGALKGKLGKTLSTLTGQFARWGGLLSTMSIPELAEIVLDESGYRAMWQAEKSPEAAGRLENLKELTRALGEFETLTDFLEHVGLVTEMESANANTLDMISLMTLHSAKGLEFDAVFLPGWEEGLFPHQRALDESGQKGLEEERRLAYVGITRARQHLIITHAANRRVYGQWQTSLPSRFLDELPKENIDYLSGGAMGNSHGALWQQEMQAILKQAGLRNDLPGEGRGEGRTREDHSTGVHAPPPPKGGGNMQHFAPGTRIFHQKFGYGTIRAVSGNHLDIAFEKAGDKKVLSEYVIKA